MSITSKRITATEPEKDLDTKAKADQKVPSKAVSDTVKPTETAVLDTAANSEKVMVAEIENQTKRLSIQDKEEEKNDGTPSKKRHFEDISAEPEVKESSFNTALDQAVNSSKKVSPESKRLKIDDTPPKMQMNSEDTVTEPEAKQDAVEEKVEEIKPAASEVVKPADEKATEPVPEVQAEAAAEVPAVSEEPKAAEVTNTIDETKPESKTMPAEEAAAITTPSVVKDIPASKLQSEAFASKEPETEKPVSSTNTLEKEYQAEVTKQDDEQIQS
jgi:hypothetical protein